MEKFSKFEKLLFALWIIVLIGMLSWENWTNKEIDTTRENYTPEEYEAVSNFSIERLVNNISIENKEKLGFDPNLPALETGMIITSFYPDGQTYRVKLNYSYPEDLSKIIGRNVMVINGFMMRSFMEESFFCWEKQQKIRLIPISTKEATELESPREWVWYNNQFYKKIFFEYNSSCQETQLVVYNEGNYQAQAFKIPKKVRVGLVGNSTDLFFNKWDEIVPAIELGIQGDLVEDHISLEYEDLEGIKKIKLERRGNFFIFDKKIKLESINPYFYPFDQPSATIYNISPGIVIDREIPIDGSLLDLEGIAYFSKEKITLKFKREALYQFKVIFAEVTLLGLLIRLRKKIKYMKRKSINKLENIKEIAKGAAFEIIGLFATVTYSYKILFNILTIFPFLILMSIIFLIRTKLMKTILNPPNLEK